MSNLSTQTRWNQIASSIRLAVERGELVPGERLPSETDMAAQWSVSPMTVHRAMQELQREGWVVRRRKIGTIIAERNAVPTRRIALVFTSLVDLPQSTYVRGIQQALGDEYQYLAFDAYEDPRREASNLKQAAAEADAIICYPSCAAENTAVLRQVMSQIPVAFVDRQPQGVVADTVMTDNKGSVLTGLQFLAERGHRNIACFMEDVPYISSVRERLEGYREFMQQYNPENVDRWIYQFPRTIPHVAFFARVEEQMSKLLNGPDKITAIFCHQDRLMAAVMEACVHLKITIPDQLEVISFNDIDPILLPLARSAHRLVQRTNEMGSIAARRLQMRMTSPELPPQVVRLQADLMPAFTRIGDPIETPPDDPDAAPPTSLDTLERVFRVGV